MFTRIAVALDGSDAAHEALAVALQLAGAQRAEVGICSVVDPILIAGTAPPSPAMDLVVRDMEIAAHRLVDEGIARARGEGVAACGQVTSGVPAYEILKFAAEFNADLIVMGTHGRKGLAHFLMGSVAEVVLRESRGPVLIVRGRVPLSNQECGADAERREPAENSRRESAATA